MALVDKLLVMKGGKPDRFGERDAVIESLKKETANVTQLQKINEIDTCQTIKFKSY